LVSLIILVSFHLSDAPEIEFNSTVDAALSIDVEVARNAHFSDSEDDSDVDEVPETTRNKSVKIAPKVPVKRTSTVADEFAEDSESDVDGKDDDEQLQKAEQEWRKIRESLDEPGRAEALRFDFFFHLSIFDSFISIILVEL
jgi:uncharacterized protein YpuA (DUF1002 family)